MHSLEPRPPVGQTRHLHADKPWVRASCLPLPGGHQCSVPDQLGLEAEEAPCGPSKRFRRLSQNVKQTSTGKYSWGQITFDPCYMTKFQRVGGRAGVACARARAGERKVWGALSSSTT